MVEIDTQTAMELLAGRDQPYVEMVESKNKTKELFIFLKNIFSDPK